MRAIVLTVADAYWYDLAASLRYQIDLDVRFWSGHQPDRARIEEMFPGCIVHETLEDMLVRGPAHAGEWPRFIIDADLADALAPVERTALMMMDRMDPTGSSFPFAMRKRHFRRLVAFWGGIMKDIAPDLVLFQISPHMVFDYIAFELAKLFGIRTLMFERTGLPGHALLTEDFSAIPVGLEQAYWEAKSRGDEPSPAGKAFIKKSAGRGEASTAPLFEAKMARLGLSQRSRTFAQPSAVQTLKREIVQLRHLYRRNGLGRQDVYFVPRGIRPEDASLSLAQLAVQRFRGRRRQKHLRRKLQGLLSPFSPDTAAPYVLLTLHYQPERATLPLGGVFSDQVLIAQALSRCLPDGWQLVVKEHPWQLSAYSRGYLQRTPEFYDDLAALKNVVLVDPETPNDALLDRARAVATITGSAGWQAICRGVPAIVFGAAWYRLCKGVFPIKNVADLESAMSAVAGPSPVSSDDLRFFVAAVEKIAIRAVIEPKGENQPNVDRGLNASRMADAIVAYLAESSTPSRIP